MSFDRDHGLDQALDICGSGAQRSDMVPAEECSCLGGRVVGQFGALASITVIGANVNVTGLTGIADTSCGNFLTISGADTAANNGTFKIIEILTVTSVRIENGVAVTDANNGAISWIERTPYSLEDDLNYIRTDRANIKGVDFCDPIPAYFRCTDQTLPIPANLANIAGKTTDAKALVVNKFYNDGYVSVGDGYITITGTFPYADSIDITGVPVNDGYDAGNIAATFVGVFDSTSAELRVLSGAEAGNRIFGRTRAGITGMDGLSIEVEFRSVPIGVDVLSTPSSAYTWEIGQPTIVDFCYGFRQCLDGLDEGALRSTLLKGITGGAGFNVNSIVTDCFTGSVVIDCDGNVVVDCTA